MSEPQTVRVVRRYTAPAERVWRAWTDPEILSRWHGCGPDQLWRIHEWDARVGGRLRVSMDMAGEPFELVGEFFVVQRPHRLRYSFGERYTVEVTVTTIDAETEVVVEHVGLPDENECAIVTAGWSHSLAALDAALKLSRGQGQRF